jgi:signal peptidase
MELVIERRRKRARDYVAAAVCLVVTTVAVAYVLPSLFGLQRYVITGSSMTGTINVGSIAFEEIVPVKELEVGDIITYAPPPDAGLDGLVTHRIISINGDTFRTQGDAVPQPDPWKFQLVSSQQSRVVFSVPYVGYVFSALTDRGTRLLVITLPAAIIGLFSFFQVLSALGIRVRRGPASPSTSAGPVSALIDGLIPSEEPSVSAG